MKAGSAPNGNENATQADGGRLLPHHPRPEGGGRVGAAVVIQQAS